METAEWLETNSRWLEALDPGSGRVYFVDLETQQSSWDAPTHFMDRKELAQALQKASSKPAGDDEATFLAKVKARFPAPPTKPPPPKMTSSLAEDSMSKGKVDELKAENARLQARIAELESRDGSASVAPPPLPPALPSNASFNVAAPPPLPVGVSKQASSSPFASPRGGAAPRRVSAVPQWKRGASSMLPLEQPPPPPAWALAMSSNSSKNVVGQPGLASKRSSLPAGGGPLHKMGAVPATAGGMPPPLPSGDRRGSAPGYGRQMNAGI